MSLNKNYRLRASPSNLEGLLHRNEISPQLITSRFGWLWDGAGAEGANLDQWTQDKFERDDVCLMGGLH